MDVNLLEFDNNNKLEDNKLEDNKLEDNDGFIVNNNNNNNISGFIVISSQYKFISILINILEDKYKYINLLNYNNNNIEDKEDKNNSNNNCEVKNSANSNENSFYFDNHTNLKFLYLPYTKISWSYIIKYKIICNHHLFRSCIIRKDKLYNMLLNNCTFLPNTYCFKVNDIQNHDILSNISNFINNNLTLYILKPNNQSSGIGIKIINNSIINIELLNSLDNKAVWCLQNYISPYLINHRKFHIRSLILSNGYDLYLYDNYIAMFSCMEYNINNFDTKIHLTNYSLNSQSDEYNDNLRLDRTELEAQLDNNLSKQIWSDLINIAITTFNLGKSNGFKPFSFCFELFGMDTLIDESGKMYILEINANCGFEHHGMKYENFTRKLVTDLLNIVIINNNDNLDEKNGFFKLDFGK